MPIDMDNMLAGFSNQVISATGGEVDFGDGASATIVIGACVLRAEDVLDVGFVVTETANEDSTVSIGRSGASSTVATHFIGYELSSTVAAGAVRRVSDGTLSWSATAATEAERSCPLGTTITCQVTDGDGTGKIVPFVIMRPQGPLDPIA